MRGVPPTGEITRVPGKVDTHRHGGFLWRRSVRWRSLTQALARQATRSPEARNCLQYLERNRPRMRYPDFHAQHLCTSSGVLEAASKVVIGSRLKRSGMHWPQRGSNAIIALRRYKLSGRFEDFWERRSQRRTA